MTHKLRDAMLKMSGKKMVNQERPLSDLDRLAIRTTDQGPFICDFFLTMVFHDGAEWVVPLENPSYQDFYNALDKVLPLDSEQALFASFSTASGIFPLWEKGKT